MSSEGPRRLSAEVKAQIEADWLQGQLRSELNDLQEASSRLGIMEHASKFCAYIGLKPKGFRVELDVTAGMLRDLGKDFKFSKKGYTTFGPRNYLQFGLPVDGSQLEVMVVNSERIHLSLREISGTSILSERRLNIRDLVGARVVKNDPLQ